MEITARMVEAALEVAHEYLPPSEINDTTMKKILRAAAEVAPPPPSPAWVERLAEAWRIRIEGIKSTTIADKARQGTLAYAISSCRDDLLRSAGLSVPTR